MTDINIVFCREVLKSQMKDVREHTTADERKAAWTYKIDSLNHWEFHGPANFFWHGRADNAYDARAKGWAAYLRKKGVEGYAT